MKGVGALSVTMAHAVLEKPWPAHLSCLQDSGDQSGVDLVKEC